MTVPLLEVRQVSKVFSRGLLRKQHLVALENFSVSIPEDRPMVVAIAGESGSGKTTLANLILGLLRPSAGHVLFKGKDLWRMTKAEWVAFRKEVQAIFQDPFEVYNPFYKVDHVLEAVVHNFRLARDRKEARRLIVETLEILGLQPNDVLGKYPHQMSGGQRQRVMIARAFLSKPRLIVADEPVSMVDASLRALILENMLRLKQEYRVSFVYITHDLSTAYQISDDIYILYLGGVAEYGNVRQVIENPHHPYTRLLVESVPVPNPKMRWRNVVELPPEDEIRTMTAGTCKFARRCPYVMDVCRQSPPPLYQVGPHQYAACFLYRDRPIKAEPPAAQTPTADR